MGPSALFVQAHDAKNSEILQRCQTPVRENRLPPERIPLPMDTHSTTTMADANGGEGYLKGLINAVPLTCGAVKAVCDMFVGDTVPFDLLLGRPWQIRNKVTIDERRAGTYLV